MQRKYHHRRQAISTLLKNEESGKEYIISTAKAEEVPVWQLAVFAFEGGTSDPTKPLLFMPSFTYEDAEKRHLATEKLVSDYPEDYWKQNSVPIL